MQLRGGVGASAAITDLLYRSAAFGIAEQLETHPLTPNPSPLTPNPGAAADAMSASRAGKREGLDTKQRVLRRRHE